MEEHTIVVIEDEPAIAEAVAARLRADGFAVETAGDGPSGVELVKRTRPSLVVLDVMLPGFDGHEVCRRIQADRQVPVIMLTARDAETDMLVGLGIGADDYMTKPFSPRELAARVKAIIRRIDRVEAVAASNGSAATSDDVRIASGDLEIDPAARRVRLRGSDLPLTATEFDLLMHLARSPGVVFSRDRLLSEVWGYPDDVGPRTVDSHVAGLRRKLGPGWLRTSRGVGYAFDPETA